MEEPRYKFEEAAWKGWHKYEFYDDRIEFEWREPFKKGKVTFPKESISGRFYEQSTFGFGVRSKAILFAIYFVLGLALTLGFQNVVLNVVGWMSFGLAAIVLGFLVSKLKTENWIYFQRPDDSRLFAVRERGLRYTSKRQLVEEIGKYEKHTKDTRQSVADDVG